MHLHVLAAELGEFLGDFIPSQLGLIAVAAEVGAENVAQAVMKNALYKISGALVGKMAVLAENALLEAGRPVGVIPQHFQIVIGLEQQNLGVPQAVGGEPGDVAEVGEPANLRGGGVLHEADGVDGVVRHGKGLDAEVANFTAVAGLEQLELEFAFMD